MGTGLGGDLNPHCVHNTFDIEGVLTLPSSKDGRKAKDKDEVGLIVSEKAVSRHLYYSREKVTTCSPCRDN